MPHALAGAKGKQAAAVKELHKYYGEVVRIAPDTLSFMTGQAWRDIYGHAATKKFKKYGYFKVRADAQPLLTVAEEDYARQRAALAHGFSERAIASQETNVIQHVNGFVFKLEEKSKSKANVDMSEWIEFLTFDIIGEFALSMHFGCVDNSKNHPWVALLANWTRAVTFAANATAFGLLTPFIMLFANIKDLKSIKVHLNQSAAKVRERLEMGEDPNKSDLWTYVLRNKGDKSLSLAEMEVNAAAILIAATAPVSDTLCGAVYLLAKNQDALRELRKEIESSMRGYEDITMSTTAKLPYLSGVISETMRCYSPSPFGGKRLTPAGGATVSGTFVPGGVGNLLSMPLY
jgi:cytochrome P450